MLPVHGLSGGPPEGQRASSGRPPVRQVQSGSGAGRPHCSPEGAAIPPAPKEGLTSVETGAQVATMPRCLLMGTPPVRTYFLQSGAVSNNDVAYWWAALGEVEEHGARLGWTSADVASARLLWQEACRCIGKDLPHVPVPGKGPEPVVASEPKLPPVDDAPIEVPPLERIPILPAPATAPTRAQRLKSGTSSSARRRWHLLCHVVVVTSSLST